MITDKQRAAWLIMAREIEAARAAIDVMPKGRARTVMKQQRRAAIDRLHSEMVEDHEYENEFDFPEAGLRLVFDPEERMADNANRVQRPEVRLLPITD